MPAPRHLAKSGANRMESSKQDPKDVDARLSVESMRLLREMNALIDRGRLLLRDREKALAASVVAVAPSLPTLGDVLYAKPSHPVVPERDWVSLVRSIASADQLALQALYERVHGPVATLIQRIIGDEQAAEELTVGVLHEVWRQAGGYDAVDGTVLAWVMNLARAAALAARRGERARVAADSIAIDTSRKSGWLEPAWQEVAPGISVKLLARDEDRQLVSRLVRLVPGGEYPAHTHAAVEELHLLEGELWIDDRKLYPGDYNRAEAGTGDKRVWSETGCMCVLVTSTRDLLG